MGEGELNFSARDLEQLHSAVWVILSKYGVVADLDLNTLATEIAQKAAAVRDRQVAKQLGGTAP